MNLIDTIQQQLYSKYKRLTLSKSEVAKEMGIGLSTLNKYMAEGMNLPNYKKIGTAKNSRVIFNVADVAEFLADTIKVA